MSFDWADPFLLGDQLTEDERMIRDSAHQFCQDRLQPRVIEAFDREITDPAIFAEMGAAGLLGVTIPEEYGGAGAGTCEGTHDVHALILGRAITGIAAF